MNSRIFCVTVLGSGEGAGIMKLESVGGFCLGGTARFCILGSGKGKQFRQFLCDAQGNRVLKEKTGAVGTVSKRTWSVRSDAGRTITWTPYGKMETVQKETVFWVI